MCAICLPHEGSPACFCALSRISRFLLVPRRRFIACYMPHGCTLVHFGSTSVFSRDPVSVRRMFMALPSGLLHGNKNWPWQCCGSALGPRREYHGKNVCHPCIWLGAVVILSWDPLAVITLYGRGHGAIGRLMKNDGTSLNKTALYARSHGSCI